MIDLPYSSRCRHHDCRRRAVRAGVCLDHWQQLYGTGFGPWPADVAPVSWRDRHLIRTGRLYVAPDARENA